MCCWPTQYIVDIRSYCSPAQWAVFVQGMVFICKVFLTYKVCCLLARFVAVNLTVRYGADLQYVLLTYMVFCWHKVTWKVCCLLTRHSVYLQSVARCLPAKCLGYLHGTMFTCKVCCLPTRHSVYRQSVLLTLPTWHGVYLQNVLFTYKARCLPAVCACLWPDPPLVASALLSWLSAPWLSLLAFHLHLLLTLRSPQSRPPSVTRCVEKNPADNLLASLYKHDLTCHSPQSFPLFSVAGYHGRKH